MMKSTAQRHEGTKARRAFSLVEVLLAIIILGIGVISIAALFPAGIAQQRLSTDDLMGPIVANHAMSVIRAKVTPEDFGAFDEFWGKGTFPDSTFTRTVRGDWSWMRPSVILTPPTNPGFEALTPGSIDIFSHFRTGQANTTLGIPNLQARIASENHGGWPNGDPNDLYGIPYNLDRPGSIPPRAIITQSERFYPNQSNLVQTRQDPAQPQYVWDCMFRRYQGTVYVAVFVYRVSAPGAAATQPFALQPRQGSDNAWQIPPVPIAIDMVPPFSGGPPDPWPTRPWDIRYDETTDRPIPEVPGFPFADFDLLAERQSWQAPRQWILDQNNNIHRVVSNRRDGNDMFIEFTRPLTPARLPMNARPNDTEAFKYRAAPDTTQGWPTGSPDEYFGDPTATPGPNKPDWDPTNPWFPNFDIGVVTRFWYLPLRMDITAPGPGSGGEFVLTPVYVAVKEL